MKGERKQVKNRHGRQRRGGAPLACQGTAGLIHLVCVPEATETLSFYF